MKIESTKTVCRIGLAALIAAAAGGCAKGPATGGGTIQLADPGPPVETVNGEAVPQKLLDALARKNGWDLARPELRERALRELTNTVILAQAAHNEKFDSDADFAAVAEVARLQGMASATTVEFQKRAAVDDSVLRAEYDKQTAKAGGNSYDFSHIVFATEAEAAKAIKEVQGGKTFDAVMKAHEKDARQQRKFTKIRAAQLPEPLNKALESMKPGETAKAPVESKFGWHVLNLTATTPYTPPPFDQVKENMKRSLTKRSADDRINKLREDAKVTMADGSAPPPANPAPMRPPMGKPVAPQPNAPAAPQPTPPAAPQAPSPTPKPKS